MHFLAGIRVTPGPRKRPSCLHVPTELAPSTRSRHGPSPFLRQHPQAAQRPLPSALLAPRQADRCRARPSPARPTRDVGWPPSSPTWSAAIWIDPDAGKIPFGEYADAVGRRAARTSADAGDLRGPAAPHRLVFAKVKLCDVHPVDVRTWHGRLAASGLHHNTVAKNYRLFRSIMTTAVDDGLHRAQPRAHQGRLSGTDDRAPAAQVGRHPSARRARSTPGSSAWCDGSGERPAVAPSSPAASRSNTSTSNAANCE